MTELLEEKCIVESCYNAQAGAYCGEQRRKIAKRMLDDGLIRYEEIKLNHIHFLGFTEKGRQKYLDAHGKIKGEYIISETDH
jgi:hypothetical protein